MPSTATPISPIINGLKGSFKQAGCTRGRNSTGFYWNYQYEGTADEVEADADACAANNLQFEVTNLTGGRKRLTFQTTVAFGDGGGAENSEVLENVWELDPQDTQKDLLEADLPFANTYNGELPLGILSSNDKLLVRKAIDAGITNKDVENGYFDEDGENANQMLSWFKLMRAGVKYFPVEATVLRHTQIVSNAYSVKASFSNVGRIISTESMPSLEGVPDLLLFDLPSVPAATQLIETPGDLQYGWRKIRPRISRINFSRWNVANNYQFGLWTVKLYGSVL